MASKGPFFVLARASRNGVVDIGCTIPGISAAEKSGQFNSTIKTLEKVASVFEKQLYVEFVQGFIVEIEDDRGLELDKKGFVCFY